MSFRLLAGALYHISQISSYSLTQLNRLLPKPVYLLYILALEMAFPHVSIAGITHADLLDIY